MKIGLLAYSTNTGLGYQTEEFYKNMKPAKVLIADLSKHNGVETHHERFHQPRIDPCTSKSLLSDESCEWLVDGMDAVFICETPLNYYLFEYANRKGVKTILQYNYEFLDYFNKPELPKPRVLATPSMWGAHVVHKKNWAEVMYWPVPIDIRRFKFRRAEKVDEFVHIIGRPAAYDRNGTIPFLKAAQMIEGDYTFTVYLQEPKEKRTDVYYQIIKAELDNAKRVLGDRLEIIVDVADNTEMYAKGQILVLPRKYGGLCLPLWEALSAGMPVIMPNIIPNNSILPSDWLVECKINGSFESRTNIILHETNPDILAKKMLEVAEHISTANMKARELAETMSWDTQRPKYYETLKGICKSSSMTK